MNIKPTFQHFSNLGEEFVSKLKTTGYSDDGYGMLTQTHKPTIHYTAKKKSVKASSGDQFIEIKEGPNGIEIKYNQPNNEGYHLHAIHNQGQTSISGNHPDLGEIQQSFVGKTPFEGFLSGAKEKLERIGNVARATKADSNSSLGPTIIKMIETKATSPTPPVPNNSDSVKTLMSEIFNQPFQVFQNLLNANAKKAV